MVAEADIRPVTVLPWEISIVRAMASTWDFPGRSNIRDRADRAGTLGTDAMVGQLGTYAGLKHLYGAGAVKEYLTSRWHANRRKFDSDDGSDVDALNLDFKASLRRDPGKTLLSYNLAVRPRELYQGWVYVLALVDLPAEDRSLVHLIGWASADMLPTSPAKEGPLAGAHVLPARELHPLPPFRWRYFERLRRMTVPSTEEIHAQVAARVAQEEAAHGAGEGQPGSTRKFTLLLLGALNI